MLARRPGHADAEVRYPRGFCTRAFWDKINIVSGDWVGNIISDAMALTEISWYGAYRFNLCEGEDLFHVRRATDPPRVLCGKLAGLNQDVHILAYRGRFQACQRCLWLYHEIVKELSAEFDEGLKRA